MGAHKEQFGQDVSPWGILMSPRQNDNQNVREETLFTLPADNSIQQGNLVRAAKRVFHIYNYKTTYKMLTRSV